MATFRLLLTCCLLLCGLAPARAQEQKGDDSRVRALAAAQVLAARYDRAAGLFHGTGWWNSANGISALAETARLTNTHAFDSIFENTFTAAQTRFAGFRNEFYDDEGWWALAWLDVYAIRPDPRYLEMARSIFTDMQGGWSESCGGGIWWKKNEHYKNAIANELFLAVAVRLAAVSRGEGRANDLAWATREGRWFLGSGMINDASLVNDGLDAACHNNRQTTWTYNQGVILTGFAQWSRLSREPAPAEMATRIASAAEKQLVDSEEVLHDPCEPACGADGVQFKGILVRHLIALPKAYQPTGTSAFLHRNAVAVWDRARTPQGDFSENWAGPPTSGGTGALISALDALNADVAGKR